MKDATHKTVSVLGSRYFKLDGEKVFELGFKGNWVECYFKCSSEDFVARMQKIDEPDSIIETAKRYYPKSKFDGVIEK